MMQSPKTLFPPGTVATTPSKPGQRFARRPSPKQSAILAALRSQPELTLSDAVRLIGGDLYANAEKHVGALMGNMVARGMIERVRPGVFRLPNPLVSGLRHAGLDHQGRLLETTEVSRDSLPVERVIKALPLSHAEGRDGAGA